LQPTRTSGKNARRVLHEKFKERYCIIFLTDASSSWHCMQRVMRVKRSGGYQFSCDAKERRDVRDRDAVPNATSFNGTSRQSYLHWTVTLFERLHRVSRSIKFNLRHSDSAAKTICYSGLRNHCFLPIWTAFYEEAMKALPFNNQKSFDVARLTLGNDRIYYNK